MTHFFTVFHFRDSIKILLILSFSFLLLALEDIFTGTIALSSLLAIMSMAVALNQFYPELSTRLSDKYSKLWIGAEVLLFVLVGTTVDLSYATSAGILAFVLIIGALVFRMLGVFLSLVPSSLNLKERIFVMLAYSPKATVQAAIGSIPLSMGLANGNEIVTVAVLSILITAPIGALAIERSYKRLLKHPS